MQPWPGEPLWPCCSATSISMERMMSARAPSFTDSCLPANRRTRCGSLLNKASTKPWSAHQSLMLPCLHLQQEELASVPFANASSQPAGNDLIRDPFLNATATRAAADNSEAETIETAMPWLKAESQQPKKRQQQRELDNAQEQAENPIALEEAPKQTAKPALSRPFDTDPKRMESGLLRVTLKPNPQRGASSAQTAGDAQLKSLSLQKRLALAWHSLRRR